MITTNENDISSEFAHYLQRYSRGEWRATIFRDLILADAKKFLQKQNELILLDIGCGSGFDCDAKLQNQLAEVASQYIGVEPDTDIQLEDIFTTAYRCRFEDAPIPPASVDIAFTVMVLEHFDDPKLFWDKLHLALRPSGVFWGFTVDARHLFVSASLLAEKLYIKNLYLNMLHGKRGEERYENYKVYYRSNTPVEIEQMTKSFHTRSLLNFQRLGQLDHYFPVGLRWIGRSYDRIAIRMGWPGSILAVRLEK